MAQKAPKVIKVVKLKRFLPETPEMPKLKRTKHPGFNSDPSSTNEALRNTYHDNEPIEMEHGSENQIKASDVGNYSESHQMQVPNRCKITFRNCSHTSKELATLHEHTDDTLVKVGDIFDTRDAFKEHLNNNAKKWHYYYVCRNSKKKIIEYNCICMAYNIKQREVVIRRQKKRTTACPCKVRLTIDQTTHKVIVYYVCNHHDHPTTPNAFYHYPHAKYLPQHVKEEFLDLTYLGLDVELIQKYIHSVVGLTIKKKDVWSYAYRFRRKIFKRSISDERQKYMEDLITKIRNTFGDSCDSAKIGRPSERDERKKNANEENEITIISDLTEYTSTDYTQDLDITNEDSVLDNTQVIVQYINEDGKLCSANGAPVTNSSAIIQFIDNYAYATTEDLEQAEFTDLVQTHNMPELPIDWAALHNESAIANSLIFESEPCVGDGEGPVLNDRAADESSNMEYLEHNESEMNESPDERSPTPANTAVYADMDNFKKYYYVDHRYITLDQDASEKNAARYKAVCHGLSNSSRDPNLQEYIKAPDFICYPSSIRLCSGHDHLTLLTEADAVWPGAKFLTHDIFLAYINERASRWFFYYSMVESGKSPENYVYKCVYGKTRVSKNAYRAKGLRKRNKLTTQCPCQIRLRRLEADPAYLTVLYSCNHHDHGLDEGQFLAQPHSRRLPSRVKEEVKDLITHRVSFDVIRKYVAAVTGVRVYGKYFHNVRAGMRARGESRHYTEQQLAIIKAKIRDLEARYGNSAKEHPEAKISPNLATNRMLHLQEYELSDKDDFAEEVCIMQADTLPAEGTAKQSRLETRLQNLSHKDILKKVKKLQDSVRSDGPRSDVSVINTYVSH